MLPSTIQCRVNITFNDYIMRDHRVHGVRILPGVTYSDLLSRILKAKGFDTNRLRLSNVLFESPVAVGEQFYSRLNVVINREGDVWKAEVTSVKCAVQDDRPLSESVRNMRGDLSIIPDSEKRELDGIRLDIEAWKRSAVRIVDVDKAYETARAVDILHGPFMKGLGNAYLTNDTMLAEVHLSDIAEQVIDDYLLHPAYMDCSTLLPFLFAGDTTPEKPYIPLYIGHIDMLGRLGRKCYVLAGAPRAGNKSADTTISDIDIFDPDGKLLVRMRKMTAKRIRSAQLITSLQAAAQVGNAPVAPVQTLAPPAATAVPVTAPTSGRPDRESVALRLLRLIAETLGKAERDIDRQTPFYDQGLESTDLLKIVTALEHALDEKLYPTLLFEYNNLEDLVDYLVEEHASFAGAVAPKAQTVQVQTPAAVSASAQSAGEAIETFLRKTLGEMLKQAPDRVDPVQPFYDQGLESTDLLKIVSALEARIGEGLYPTLLFEYNNLEDLKGFLLEEHAGAFGADATVAVSRPPAAGQEPARAPGAAAPVGTVADRVLELVAGVVGKKPGDIDRDMPFYDQGMESTDLLKIVSALEAALGESLYPTLLFEYNNVEELAAFLADEYGAEKLGRAATRGAASPSPAAAGSDPLTYIAPRFVATQMANYEAREQVNAVWFLPDESALPAFQHQTRSSIAVFPGGAFRETESGRFTMRPDSEEDFAQLLATLKERRFQVASVVYGWALPIEGRPEHDTFWDRQVNFAMRIPYLLTKQIVASKPAKRVEIVSLYYYGSESPALGEALGGLAQTLRGESPKIRFSLLGLPQTKLDHDIAAHAVRVCNAKDDQREFRLIDGQIHARRLVVQAPKTPLPVYRDGQVVIITGGLGGLGLMFAKQAAGSAALKLVLTGRSALSAELEKKLEQLRIGGSEVIYERADVASRDQVKALVKRVVDRFGAVHGIIHGAGLLRDNFLIRKDSSEIDQVFAPKLLGTANLDFATQSQPLEFFFLFSSISSLLGNPGQSDYASANRFMDLFAAYRQTLVDAGKRRGTTRSLNWPLWREGGMQIDAESEARMKAGTGMGLLDSGPGLNSLGTFLALDVAAAGVLQGDLESMKRAFHLLDSAPPTQTSTSQTVIAPPARPAVRTVIAPKSTVKEEVEVAIVGVSGRYPLADDLDAFWHNLLNGRDCIREIPDDRWNWRAYFDEKRGTRGKMYAKWGGFMDDIDKFDPLFFKMPPRAADVTDPQERLFLECAWSTLEDAGVRPSSLSGKEIGVYVGVMWGHYELFGVEEMHKGNPITPSSSFASVANHVSYILNLRGPSVALDTMCSSSLTSVHLAYRAIQNGECDAALAGGVNLAQHPYKYLMLCNNNMLSSDGRCRAFGEGGDGYVPGEGVGAVYLKRLDHALRDGDQVYAVIRGSRLNHGGKSSGYMVPSPTSQGDLIKATYESFDVDPRSLGYIESHGTGTSLGDPIEIQGLERAFRGRGVEQGSISIGSVKSNIGHLESAAGVAAITKVLLQMKHRTLAPSIHTQALNPNINFDRSPFKVQRQAGPWEGAQVEGRNYPLRAGISSFGAGGSNAHIILEAFEPASRPAISLNSSPQLFLLSAANEERLQAYAARLLHFVDRMLGDGESEQDDRLTEAHQIMADIIGLPKSDFEADAGFGEYGAEPVHLAELARALRQRWETDLDLQTVTASGSLARLVEVLAPAVVESTPVEKISLTDIAYTLQVGREAMDQRAAFTASTHEALREMLAALAEGRESAGLWLGDPDALDRGKGLKDEDDMAYLQALMQKGKLEKVARFWLDGAKIDWSALPRDHHPRRVSLPSYPFERRVCKLPVYDGALSIGGGQQGALALHPLLDSNESTLAAQRYRKTLRPEDAVISEHKVQGGTILPGVAYLEMVREAGSRAAQAPVSRIENLIWVRPIAVGDQPVDVYVELKPSGQAVSFHVFTNNGDRQVVHCKGKLHFETEPAQSSNIDIHGLKQQLGSARTHQDIYRAFRELGFDYGPSFRVTQQLYPGSDQALSRLQPHENNNLPTQDFYLDPGLLDGALRTVAGVGGEGDGVLRVPFALGSVSLYGPVNRACYVHAQISEQAKGDTVKFNLNILDDEGRILVAIKDFTARAYSGDTAKATPSPVSESATTEDIYYFRPEYQDVNLAAGKLNGPLVIFGEGTLLDEIDQQEGLIKIALDQDGRPDHRVNPLDQKSYEGLLKKLGAPAAAYLYLVPKAPDSRQEELQVGFLPLVRFFSAVTAAQANQPVRVLVVHHGDAVHTALSGMANSIAPINRRFEMAVIKDNRSAREALSDWQAILAASGRISGREYRYQGTGLQQRMLSEVQAPRHGAVGLKQGGTYLITGGMGGLGLIFARYLASRYGAKLALIGRSPSNEEKEARLAELRGLGGDAHYFAGDVATQAEDLLKQVAARFGKLDGVFHSAGVVGKAAVNSGDDQQLFAPLDAKIFGTSALFQAGGEQGPELFVLFGSVSSVLGDFGAAGYAVGNRYLEALAEVMVGKAGPRVLTIAWPFWDEGGLGLDKEQADLYAASTGMSGLREAQGLQAFEAAMRAGDPVVLPAVGDHDRICKALGVATTATTSETIVADHDGAVDSGDLRDTLENYLKKVLSDTLGIPMDRIKAKANFEKYGLDSIIIMDINAAMENDFPDLPKTLFFEYASIRQLSGWFLEERAGEVRAKFGSEEPSGSGSAAATQSATAVQSTPVSSGPQLGDASRFAQTPQVQQPKVVVPGPEQIASEPIAVIGIAGRYPMADDLETFWQNLLEGKNCLQPVPSDRWDNNRFLGEKRGLPDKTYLNFGGFLKDVDQFDPLLFQISPAQAEFMDPQERLLLENVWRTLEDAGYAPETLSRDRDGEVTPVGLFFGTMYRHYGLFAPDTASKSSMAINGYSTLVNRASYFFDFQGPSIALDTACSASLTAVHLACESLKRGECRTAVAGGVNLSIHPYKYIGLCQAAMVGDSDQSKPFGDGDGFIPGEGIGSVLLKPLSEAQKDGDRIYAVIRGGSMNHGGRTNGYAVPNPNAQADLVRAALSKSGVDPESVSYVEAASNGSALGDPIELAALNRVFRGQGDPVAIGTVKSNIGHLEAASGISQLTKVILQLKNRKLVPSINHEPANPNLNLGRFRIQKETRDWQVEGERVAAISSFGAGGSNTHLVVAEAPESKDERSPKSGPFLFVYSGFDQKRLLSVVKAQAAYLEQHSPRPEDVAMTLMVGRKPLAKRLSVVAEDLNDLRGKLRLWLAEPMGRHEGCWSTQTAKEKADNDDWEDDDLRELIVSADLPRLAQLWAAGLQIEWRYLPHTQGARRIALPGYTFNHRALWIGDKQDVLDQIGQATEHRTEPKIQTSKPVEPVTKPEPVALGQLSDSSTFNGAVEALLQVLLQEALKLDGYPERDENLQAYGLDSFSMSSLVPVLQALCGQEIPAKTFFTKQTVAEMATYLVESELIGTEKFPLLQSLLQARSGNVSPDLDLAAEPVSEAVSDEEEMVPAISPLEEKVGALLCALLSEMTGRSIAETDRFEAIAVDEGTVRKLTAAIQAFFSYGMDPSVVREQESVASLATYLVEQEIAASHHESKLDLLLEGMRGRSSSEPEEPVTGPASEVPVSRTASLENVAPAEQALIIILQEIITRLLKLDEAAEIDRDLLEYGLDSFVGGNLINELETLLEIRVPARTLFDAQTIVEIAAILVADLDETVKGRLERAVGAQAETVAVEREEPSDPEAALKTALAHILQEKITRLLKLDEPAEVDRDLLEYGLDSFVGGNLISEMEALLDMQIPARTLFDAQTIIEIAAILVEAMPVESKHRLLG